MTNKTRERKGFSVLELLLVIMIINIVAAMLLAAIHSSREKSRLATCINNQRNITSSLIMYALDNNTFPTNLTALNQNEDPPYYASNLSSFWNTNAYVYATNASGYFDGQFTNLVCPEIKHSDNYIGISYSMNELIQDVNYSYVMNPSKILAITDGLTSNTVSYPNDIDFRHHGYALAGFLDGHVEIVKPGNLYEMDEEVGGVGYSNNLEDIDANFNNIPDQEEFIEEIIEEEITLDFSEEEICSNDFCWQYNGIVTDTEEGTSTITFTLTNDNEHALSNAAFELPIGVLAVHPTMMYNGHRHTYNIENGTYNPFYSIKFETIGEGIKEGAQEVFSFTLNTSDVELIEGMIVYAKASRTIGQGEFE